MKRFSIVLLWLFACSVFAAEWNFTNDTVFVKEPTAANHAASKNYADSLPGASAVTNATVADSTSNYVNKVGAVLEFGIKTNYTSSGGVVDTNSLRAATIICTNISGAGIVAALAQVTSGGELYLPAGSYNCSNVTIAIPTSNITIRGSGWGTILNANYGSGQTNAVILLGGYANTTLRDFQISSRYPNGGFYSIQGNSASEDNISIQRLWLFGPDSGGIYGNNSGQENWTIEGCRIQGNTLLLWNGIHCKGQVHIRNCYVSGCYGSAIYLETQSGGSIENCYVALSSSDSADGIYVASGQDMLICGNYILGGTSLGYGVFNASARATIVNNVVSSVFGAEGVRITGNYCTLSGNVVWQSGNTYADIAIASDYNTIIGNVCYSASSRSEWGIQLAATADYNTISGNTVATHDTAGISELAGAHHNLITGNNCSGELVARYSLAGTNRIGISTFSPTDYAPSSVAGSNTYWTGAFREGCWITGIAGKTTSGTAVVDVVKQYMTNGILNYTTIYTGLTATAGAYTSVVFNAAILTNYQVGIIVTNLTGCTDLYPSLDYVTP